VLTANRAFWDLVGGEARVVQIEYSNIEKANLVPEF